MAKDKMKRFFGLKLKLIIPLLFILILVFFASSLVIIQRESNAAKDSLIISAESYSSLSAVYVVDNYELYYESGFYKFAEIMDDLMALNENVERIQILDVNGKILFDSNEIEYGKYDEGSSGERFIDDNETIERAGSSVSSTREVVNDIRFIDIIQPYLEEWGRHDYSVRYFVSLSSLEEMTQEMISTVFIYSGLFILISFFLIFFLFKGCITSPVGELIKGVRMMGKGKLGHIVKINSEDEIGELASAFNKMTVDLKNQEIVLRIIVRILKNR